MVIRDENRKINFHFVPKIIDISFVFFWDLVTPFEIITAGPITVN